MWGAGENGELGTGRSKNEQQPTLVQELSGEALISLSVRNAALALAYLHNLFHFFVSTLSWH
jgi:hypothetical protein